MSSQKLQLRTLLRWIHILASVMLGTFIYSPWRTHQTVLFAMSLLIFPTLSLTGLWMWQGHRIKQWLKPKITNFN